MPSLDNTTPKNPTAQKWQVAFKNAFTKRISADRLAGPFQELAAKNDASPYEIACVLLGFRSRDSGLDDPLLFSYAQLLLSLQIIASSHLLLALFAHSRYSKRTMTGELAKPSSGLPTCEERIFTMLTQLHMTAVLPLGGPEAHGVIFSLTRWMHAIAEYETATQLEAAVLAPIDAFSFNMNEALALLSLTILGNPIMREIAKQPWWKPRRATVVGSMENFDIHVLQWMQSQLSGRLRALTTIPPFLETDSSGKPILSDQQILQSIQDLPVVNTRAGLFIWLSACLCGRPLTDDLSMMTYLQARYSGETQSLMADFLLACFDVLTNALVRKEPEASVRVIRSFICNRVPSLLAMLSGFVAAQMTAENCIQVAFMSITMDALPPISAGATEVRESLKTARLEFLQTCVLQNLVSENVAAAILQEPISLPKVNKYNKEALITQCSKNFARIVSLLDELDGMVGNAGAIAGCIVDTINNLCAAKDTISLKNVCNTLIKKVSCLDIILQYTQPANILQPLCTQLSEWVHDQDQTEFTPSYEEFASILLMVFAVIHRYGLVGEDLGMRSGDNFIVKLLRETSTSKAPNELTDEQNAQLTRWVEGLYTPDESGETSGISDEVMRQCPPQAFYLLVPTLFEQSVLACKSKVLPVKTFKSGLELLVEPFLLPSLISGLDWLVKHSWKTNSDVEIMLQVLEKLLRPSISIPETRAMHKAVLDVVASPLHQSLQDFARKKPTRKEVSALLEILKPHLDLQRTVQSRNPELESWVSTPDGGMAGSVRNAIRDQVLWISDVGATAPPKYTHRIFAAGREVLGVEGLLDVIVAEIANQTSIGHGSLVLDICTAILTAPTAMSQAWGMGLNAGQPHRETAAADLRDCLRLRTADVQKLLQIPVAKAEALVRLGRRVESQLMASQIPQIPMPIALPDQAADQIMADLGLADDVAATADTSMNQTMQLVGASSAGFNSAELSIDALGTSMDLGTGSAPDLANMSAGPSALEGNASQTFFDALGLDLGQTADGMQNQSSSGMGMGGDDGENPDEDIFADLDMLGGDDFNFS